MLAANENRRMGALRETSFDPYATPHLDPPLAELMVRLAFVSYRRHFKPASGTVLERNAPPVATEPMLLHGKPLTFEDINLDFYDVHVPEDHRRTPDDPGEDIWKVIEEHLALRSLQETAPRQTRTIGEGKNDGGRKRTGLWRGAGDSARCEDERRPTR